ncbi:MAG TPA: DUF3299 domain-containing protein [Longimicrobiales bacterium]
MIQRLHRNSTTRVALLSACVLLLGGMRPAVAPGAMDGDTILAEIERAIAAGDPVTLDWKAMAALNYKTGEMPESLRRLNGVEVRIPGFMVPLEDTETRVTEFLLVPYFGACIHTPPPPPNQMVHVLMHSNQVVDVNLWDPIWIVGRLKIESVESPYGMVGYQLTGERILPYDG